MFVAETKNRSGEAAQPSSGYERVNRGNPQLSVEKIMDHNQSIV